MDRAAAVVAMLSKPLILDCIVWGNPSHYFLDEQMIQTKPYYVRYSDIEFGHAGEGNLKLDPLFVGLDDHPFALAAGSPCRDSGVADTTGLELPALDLAGSPRLSGGRVDLGGYEWDEVVGAVESGLIARASPVLRIHPNPFNPSTTLAFTLSRRTTVDLEIYDVAGRRVRTLVTGESREPGHHEVRWSGRDEAGKSVAAGVYVCRMSTDDASAYQRLVLVR
jgi:hypothetical protein